MPQPTVAPVSTTKRMTMAAYGRSGSGRHQKYSGVSTSCAPAHPGHVPERPVHGEREQGDDRDPAGGLGDEADRQHGDGEAER